MLLHDQRRRKHSAAFAGQTILPPRRSEPRCENWLLRPNVTYTANNSNVPINDFDRVVVGIDITMQF